LVGEELRAQVTHLEDRRAVLCIARRAFGARLSSTKALHGHGAGPPLPACGERALRGSAKRASAEAEAGVRGRFRKRRARSGDAPSPSLRCAALASSPTRGTKPSPRTRGEEQESARPITGAAPSGRASRARRRPGN